MYCQSLLKLWLFLVFFGSIHLKSSLLAQVIPDRTLSNENSIVNPNAIIKDTRVDLIEGGAIRGDNLFHSFRNFNIPDGGNIYFATPDNIANIITRVTGNNSSEIFGTLGVNGNANLFLLNPHGIIFGENSALDLSGSFLATTGDRYIFSNNFEYSASNPESPPLLTINLPLGLQMGNNPQAIINRSRFSNSEDLLEGLAISSQETLSLVGGEVLLEGGYLSTSLGNLDIGSVGGNNKINLQSNSRGWNLGYEEVTVFEDININNQGGIDGGELGGSNVTLTGKNISLGYSVERLATIGYDLEDFFTLEALPRLNELGSDFINIAANNSHNQVPSKIFINASDTFSIINAGGIDLDTTGTGDAGILDIIADSVVFYRGGLTSSSLENSSGNAGTVVFNVGRMSIQNGGGGVNTFGSGDGGVLELNIANDLKIQFGGFGADTFDTGDGGRIKINANNLDVIYGGAGVNTVGSGNGGVLELNITNDLKIQFGGFGANTFDTGNGGSIEIQTKVLDLNNGGIGVNAGNIGQGGQIEIQAETIFLENSEIASKSGTEEDIVDFDRQQLQAQFGQRDGGNAGLISIAANSIFLKDGGKINTTTIGRGNAGTIDLKVDRLQLQGDENTAITSSTDASGNGGNINIIAGDLIITGEAGIFANVNPNEDIPVDLTNDSIGNAGDIYLQAKNTIQLEDKGRISVDGGNEGGSGNISLTAREIDLQGESIISATVELGNEGNIVLNADNLFLDDRSQITTNATNNSTGGNIAISLEDNLVMKANSQVVSNAVAGRGGSILIRTKGLFRTFNSTIEASSEFGIDGSVRVDTFDGNSTSALIRLPDNPVDPSHYLTAGCGLDSNDSLIDVGRGGLPTNLSRVTIPNQLLPDLEIKNTRELAKFSKDGRIPNSDRFSLHKNPITEAATWKINRQGNIELIPNLVSRQTLTWNNGDRQCLQNIGIDN